jgi:hypothetical protein
MLSIVIPRFHIDWAAHSDAGKRAAAYATLTEPMKVIAALFALCAVQAYAQTPAGWQVVKDRKQLCQVAVPPGWTADKIMPGNLTAPDKKANVIVGGKPAGVTYADIVKMAKEMFKPVKMFEETASRTWFASTPDRGKKGTSWYVAMNTAPVCEAQIEFQDPAFEGDAKQMIASLKSAK